MYVRGGEIHGCVASRDFCCWNLIIMFVDEEEEMAMGGGGNQHDGG